MATIVVDTHALIWFLEGNPRLSERAQAALTDPESVLVLPVIALAEAMWIVDAGRTGIPDVASLLGDVLADPRVRLDSLTADTAIAAQGLTRIPEMHDRQIVATALRQGEGAVPVVTRDESISASKLVEVIW